MSQNNKTVPFPSLNPSQVELVFNIVSELPYKHVGQIIEMIKTEAVAQAPKVETPQPVQETPVEG